MIRALGRQLLKIAWFLPGFLLWASFPPMGEKTDILFALAPLLWLSRRGNAKESAKRWFQSGIFFWVATLSWFPAIIKNGGPWPLVVLGWFGLSAYCASFFAAFGFLSAKVWQWANEDGSEKRRLFAALIAEPVLWAGLEFIRSRLMGGFAWNQLGVVPANGGFGAPAALGGVYLLSAIVILINGTVAGIVDRVFHRGSPWRSLETMLAFGLVFCFYELAPQPAAVETTPIKVALVQRNFPCVFQEKEERPLDIYERLFQRVADLKPDLILLSESAMAEFAPLDLPGAIGFAAWAQNETGAPILAGGGRTGDGKSYNSAALYEDPRHPQIYDKVHLVPFGEFIPGDKLIPALQNFAPVGSCTPGEVKTLSFRDIPFGVAICFEDTDSAQMRALVKKGARFLAFITNDSWFSRSIEPEQHAWQATARAIETGLPVARVGNSGVTGTISPNGQASWLVDAKGRVIVDQEATMLDRLEVATSPVPFTPYVVMGDIPLFCIFLLLIILMIVIKYKHEREKRRFVPVQIG